MADAMNGRSSGTTTWLLHSQPFSAISVSSAAPAVSSFMPRVSEHVIMAKVMFRSMSNLSHWLA